MGVDIVEGPRRARLERGLADADGRQWILLNTAAVLSSLPGPVAPHDSAKLFVPVATVESNFDLRQPLRAWVSLATGETITSNGRRLLARDLAPGRVAEHLHRGRTS